MEKDATSTKRPSRIVCPNAVITSTIRTPPQTRRFMKTLSALTGMPICPRGKSSLDEIAYFTKNAGFTSFLVVFSHQNKPSRIDIYILTPQGFFEKLGYLLIEDFNILRKPPACVGTELTLIGENAVSQNLWRLIIDAFGNDSCSAYPGGKISKCKIESENGYAVMAFWEKDRLLVEIQIRDARYSKE